MSAIRTSDRRPDLALQAARIEAHLARLAAGHDPMGHLFAIERLARSARAEWWEAQHQPEHRRQGP